MLPEYIVYTSHVSVYVFTSSSGRGDGPPGAKSQRQTWPRPARAQFCVPILAMARGRPFPRSVSRLVRGEVASRPQWLATVERVPPHFAPVLSRQPPALVYEEDRLRSQYLRANPDVRKHPLNLNASSKAEAHTADRFVSIQLRAMREQGLDESAAYSFAETVLLQTEARTMDKVKHIQTALTSDLTPKERAAQIFLASLKDSQVDKEMKDAMASDAKGNKET